MCIGSFAASPPHHHHHPLECICICPLWSMNASPSTDADKQRRAGLSAGGGSPGWRSPGLRSASTSTLLLVKRFQNVSASKNKRSLVRRANPTGAFLAGGGNYCRFQSCDGSSRTGLQRSLVRLTDGRWRRAPTDWLVCPKKKK